jgi:hypothetical protein
LSPGWLKALTVGASIALGLILTILGILLMLLLLSSKGAAATWWESLVVCLMVLGMYAAGLVLMVGGPYLLLKGAIPLQ